MPTDAAIVGDPLSSPGMHGSYLIATGGIVLLGQQGEASEVPETVRVSQAAVSKNLTI
jgi:hypothetical protein